MRIKRIKIRITILFNVLIILANQGLLAQINQESSVQSTSGGTAQSESFSMIATVGQTIPPGEISTDQILLQSGFMFFLQDTLGDIQAPTAPQKNGDSGVKTYS